VSGVFAHVRRLPEFEKDLKKLSKRFRTLPEDLETFIETELQLFHKLSVAPQGIVRIDGLGVPDPPVYKARKFACRALKGRGVQSGIRVIYAWRVETDTIELIEMYFKADKENEDRERIKRYYT